MHLNFYQRLFGILQSTNFSYFDLIPTVLLKMLHFQMPPRLTLTFLMGAMFDSDMIEYDKFSSS